MQTGLQGFKQVINIFMNKEDCFFKNTFIFDLPDKRIMNKGTTIFILILLLSAGNCYSQQLSSQVLLPAAGDTASGSITYSQSIGETAVEIISNSGFILTQGFQQPVMILVPEHKGIEVNVYPNPAKDFITVRLYGDEARKFKVEIISITGKISTTKTLEFASKYYYEEPFVISGLSEGFYFVRVTSSDGVVKRIFKFEKM